MIEWLIFTIAVFGCLGIATLVFAIILGGRVIHEAVENQRIITEHAIDLLASKDSLAYQQIRSMDTSIQYEEERYDPSDEAELERLRRLSSLQEEAELNAIDQEIFDEFGNDPLFFTPEQPRE
jgi:hypothetical protein